MSQTITINVHDPVLRKVERLRGYEGRWTIDLGLPNEGNVTLFVSPDQWQAIVDAVAEGMAK